MGFFYWTLLILGGFFLGSIMFCGLIPKIVLQKDVVAISVDNNPGAFNVFKHCGNKIGIPCLLLDGLKGLIPVLLASLLMDTDSIAFSCVLVAPVLGHAVGLFNKFHGGKCITVSFGVMLGLIPVTWIGIVSLAALFVLFTAVIKISPASKRSLVVYALFEIIVCPVLGVLRLFYVMIGCGAVSLLPIIKFVFSKNGMVENNYYDIGINNEHTNRSN